MVWGILKFPKFGGKMQPTRKKNKTTPPTQKTITTPRTWHPKPNPSHEKHHHTNNTTQKPTPRTNTPSHETRPMTFHSMIAYVYS